MDQGFLKYLIETKKIDPKIVANISATFNTGADYETENKINDIIEILQECQLDPNIYLIEYPGLIELAKIEDKKEFELVLGYIRDYYKKNKKEKNPYLLIQLMLASKEILEKQKQQETEQIISLLKKEGLLRIFEPKTNKKKVKVERILHADYSVVSRNVNILKRERTYKELVYANPLILVISNEMEVRKLLEEYQNANKKEDKEIQKEQEKAVDDEVINDIQNDSNDNDNDDSIEQKDDEKKIDKSIALVHTMSLQEKKLLELGDEENVIPVLEAFNRYGISYDILSGNPEILKRTKIFNIPMILHLIYLSNIPFSILYDCPEILESGKTDEIAKIIEELKTRGISLNILIICPSILIKSTPERIRELFIKIEENNIDKYLVYSTSAILISGDIDKYIKSIQSVDNDLMDNIKEVKEIIPSNYIIFKQLDKLVNSVGSEKTVKENDKYSLIHNNRFDIGEIIVVEDVKNVKEVLNTLNCEGIDTEIVTREPGILSQKSEDILEISKNIKKEKLGLDILTKEPLILVNSSISNMNNVMLCLNKFGPQMAKKIVKNYPALLYLANIKDMENVFEQLRINNIDFSIVEVIPQILLRKDSEEISKIISNLNVKGYKIEQIVAIPDILVKGKEKYIDRNFKTFEKNQINIPLSIAYCISARNNEKNIDTLIENNLEKYIELNPEILELKNSRLEQMIALSKQNKIPVLKNIKDRRTREKMSILNMEYFKSTDEQIANKYDLDVSYIKNLGIKAEREDNKLRKVKSVKLYDAIYPILEKQALTELNEYRADSYSYLNNEKRISKQKVIREVYLDLEAKSAKEGKSALKCVDTKKMLTRKLKNLSRNSMKKDIDKKEILRNERN